MVGVLPPTTPPELPTKPPPPPPPPPNPVPLPVLIVGVFDGEKIYLYVNGELKASQTAEGTLQDSDRPISIGNFPEWSAYNGIIDDIRLYDNYILLEIDSFHWYKFYQQSVMI